MVAEEMIILVSIIIMVGEIIISIIIERISIVRGIIRIL